jgi:Domain found in IF2B/IF5
LVWSRSRIALRLALTPALRHCLPLTGTVYTVVQLFYLYWYRYCLTIVCVGYESIAAPNFCRLFLPLCFCLQHLLAFLFAELGTSGAIDGNNQLIMKGRFQQKHIENVLRRYIKEYVTCHTCRSPDTILNKETRLFFLQVSKQRSGSEKKDADPAGSVSTTLLFLPQGSGIRNNFFQDPVSYCKKLK